MKDGSGRRKLFGTNGIRGVPNEDLTMDFCLSMGKAIGSAFECGNIAIARDTRVSGQAILNSVISGILSTGKDVTDLGVLPTPALQYYCKHHSVCGVVITASHNPPEFNGIKCIDSDGTELAKEDENRIEDIFYSREFSEVDWERMGGVSSYTQGITDYIAGIAGNINADSVRKRKFRVAFDAGNGASYLSTPSLLSLLGCTAVTLNCNPDGKFSSRPSEPKEENLGALKEIMKTGRFDLGIAHDGDADRAVFFNERGEFIDGDRSLSLLVGSVIGSNDTVVTPVSSSDILEDLCRDKGATLIRTKVGAPVVSRAMIEHKARIGGEENGGVIFSDHQFCRDGAMTAALFLNLMAESGRKASELIAGLPEYYLYKTSLKLEENWKGVETRFQEFISGSEVDRTDGFKVHEADGWALIRPSGTEPIVRIYGHARSMKRASEIAEKYTGIIKKIQKS